MRWNRRLDSLYIEGCHVPDGDPDGPYEGTLGGQAGGIVISYKVPTCNECKAFKNITNCTIDLSNLTLSNCHGGVGNWIHAAGAGGIAIQYLNCGILNSHYLADITLTNCSGGSNMRYGAGAGGIAIAYSGIGSYNNTNYLADVTLNNCTGGNDLQYGAGAGGIAIAFRSFDTYQLQFSHLSHLITNELQWRH